MILLGGIEREYGIAGEAFFNVSFFSQLNSKLIFLDFNWFRVIFVG